LHIARPGAKLYPEHFLNEKQREKLAQGKLRYLPGPTSVIEGDFNEVSDVIEAPLLVGFVGKKERTGHPSQKPVSVFEKLILMTTVPGDLVFDPMSGSGTTGAAAHRHGRLALLSDHCEEFVLMSEQRLGVNRIPLENSAPTISYDLESKGCSLTGTHDTELSHQLHLFE